MVEDEEAVSIVMKGADSKMFMGNMERCKSVVV